MEHASGARAPRLPCAQVIRNVEFTAPTVTVERPETGLREYLQILVRRRYWFAGVVVAVLALALVYTLTSTPIYQSRCKLLVSTSQPGFARQSGDVLGDIMGTTKARTLETQLEVIRSQAVMDPALRAFLEKHPDWRRPSTRVEGAQQTDVIIVSCQSPEDPKPAAEFANLVAREYIDFTLSQNRETAEKAASFAEDQMEKAGAALAKAEEDLETFRNAAGNSASAPEAITSLLTRVQVQEDQASQSQATADATRAKLKALRVQLKRKPELVLASQTLSRNQVLDTLRNSLAQLEVERAALLQDMAPTSQRIKTLDDKIAATRNQLGQETQRVVSTETQVNPVEADLLSELVKSEAQLGADEVRARSAAQSLAETRRQVVALPSRQRQESELQRAVMLADTQYRTLAAKVQELRLAQESTLSNAKVIEDAEPGKIPIKPAKRKNMILALMLALVLAAAVIMLVDYLDDTFSGVEEIERELTMPVLSVVHRQSPGEPVILGSPLGRSPFAEAYRTLRSALRFSNVKKQLKMLAVTSAGAGEGKSTTSLNLAIASAEGGQRVILVDADLRRPSLHRVLGLENTSGLTQCLVNNVHPSQVVKPTDHANLSIITTGPLPPNPAELLDTERMKELAGQLREMADLVIIDTPPAAVIVDAWIISRVCDAILLVVKVDQAKRPAVRRIAELFKREDILTPGVVMNHVRRGLGSSYYYSYYYYHYYAEDGTKHKKRGRRKHSSGLGSAENGNGNGNGHGNGNGNGAGNGNGNGNGHST